jgi:hypothetical protein
LTPFSPVENFTSKLAPLANVRCEKLSFRNPGCVNNGGRIVTLILFNSGCGILDGYKVGLYNAFAALKDWILANGTFTVAYPDDGAKVGNGCDGGGDPRRVWV